MQKKLATDEYRGTLIVWTRLYPSKISNAILPRTLAVFAVGSTLLYCYDLRPIYDTKKYYVQEQWNETKSGHQGHVVLYIPCS